MISARTGPLLALLLLLAGCGHAAPKISESKLSSLVLQPSDLPSGFAQFAGGTLARADLHPGPRADPNRFGHLGGWIARFQRSGATARTPGPLVVESRADLFRTGGGAKQDLDAYRGEFETTEGARLLDAPALGEGAQAMVQRQANVRFFSLAWRERNATALVLVEGFAGRISLAAALALARKQDRHLLDAAREALCGLRKSPVVARRRREECADGE